MRFKICMSKLLIDERMRRARVNKGFNGSRNDVKEFGGGNEDVKCVRI